MLDESWFMAVFYCSFSAAQSPKQIILTPSRVAITFFFFQLQIGVFINFPNNLWKKETQNENFQIPFITVSPYTE